MKVTRDLTVRAAARLPQRMLFRVETLMGLALGRGWGAASVRDEAKACLSLLCEPTARPLQVVDIGSNVGNWSLQILNLAPAGTHLIAYEPNSIAFAEAQRRLATWDTAQVVEAALGPVTTSGHLIVPEGRISHGIVEPCQTSSCASGFHVQMSTLDEQVSQYFSGDIDIIKIDAEGGEWGILQGGTVSVSRTAVVQFEYGEHSLKKRVLFRDFWEYFAIRDFQLWVQTPRGIMEVKQYSQRWESTTCTNFFARRR